MYGRFGEGVGWYESRQAGLALQQANSGRVALTSARTLSMDCRAFAPHTTQTNPGGMWLGGLHLHKERAHSGAFSKEPTSSPLMLLGVPTNTKMLAKYRYFLTPIYLLPRQVGT